MAHPKHKVSSTRRDKRRTHYKAVVPTVVTLHLKHKKRRSKFTAPFLISIIDLLYLELVYNYNLLFQV